MAKQRLIGLSPMSLQARKCSLISTRHARKAICSTKRGYARTFLLLIKEGRYTMPDRDVYFWGRFAKNDDTMVMLGVEVYVDGNPKRIILFIRTEVKP